MKPSGAHTHPDSGSGIVGVVAVVLAAVIAASIAGPVIAAVTELLETVLIIAGVLLGLALTAVAAFVVYRLRHPAQAGRTPVLWHDRMPPAGKPAELRTEPRRALQAPSELHLHLHGVTAEDVAAILRRELP